MKAGQEGILTNSTPGFSTSHHIASLIFAQQFGVMSIPTLILFKDGQVVDTLVGYHPKAALEDLIKKAL